MCCNTILWQRENKEQYIIDVSLFFALIFNVDLIYILLSEYTQDSDGVSFDQDIIFPEPRTKWQSSKFSVSDSFWFLIKIE